MKPIKLKDILQLFHKEGAEVFIKNNSIFYINLKRGSIVYIKDEYKKYLDYEVDYIIDGYDEYDLIHIELKEKNNGTNN